MTTSPPIHMGWPLPYVVSLVPFAWMVACTATESGMTSSTSADGGVDPLSTSADVGPGQYTARQPETSSTGLGTDGGGLDDSGEDAISGAADARGSVPVTGTPIVYVSSIQQPRGITAYTLDVARGSLTLVGREMGTTPPNSAVLTWGSRGETLYSIRGTDPRALVSFSINRTNGALTPLNEVAHYARYLATDPAGRWLFVAGRYGGLTVYALQDTGAIGASVGSEDLPEIKSIRIDPTGRLAYVLVGATASAPGYIAQYKLEGNGRLAPSNPARTATASGASDPSFLAFHPTRGFAYVINANSTMTAYRYDSADGNLEAIETVTTLPSGFSGTSSGAAVEVHPSGKFLFGLNQGHNSVVTYTLDATTGHMSAAVHQSHAALRNPLSLSVEAGGKYLFVVSEAPNPSVVVVFGIDATTGRLTEVGEPVTVENHAAFVGSLYL